MRLSVEDIADEFYDYDVPGPAEEWTHINFKIYQEDVGIFAKLYLKMKKHRNPRDIKSVDYDERFNKALDFYGDSIEEAGAYQVIYQDGSEETFAYDEDPWALHRVKWVEAPLFPKISYR